MARYLSQLDTADRQELSEALAAKTAHLKEKLAKLASEVERLKSDREGDAGLVRSADFVDRS